MQTKPTKAPHGFANAAPKKLAVGTEVVVRNLILNRKPWEKGVIKEETKDYWFIRLASGKLISQSKDSSKGHWAYIIIRSTALQSSAAKPLGKQRARNKNCK